jgi:7,8-dihydro-6-hydroxymethylpterin-pyrophosphokinase
MVISIETQIEPVLLLHELKIIEEKTGRIKRERWHEREIDIDILLYGERIVNEKSLNIPHKELKKRDFFLVPLLEINPDLILPGEGIFLSSLKIVAEKSYIKGWNRNFFRMKRGVVFLDEK